MVVVVVVRVGVADEGYGVGLENGEKWSVCVSDALVGVGGEAQVV